MQNLMFCPESALCISHATVFLNSETAETPYHYIPKSCSGICNNIKGNGGPSWIPGQSMGFWNWDRFFSWHFGFLLSISFHNCSILIFHSRRKYTTAV